MDMAFLCRFLYSSNTLGSELEDGAFPNLSLMSQRSMDTNNILILNFQR